MGHYARGNRKNDIFNHTNIDHVIYHGKQFFKIEKCRIL